MSEDSRLVGEAVAGSREAFDELVRLYQARIVNLARALTADDGDADDLAQEAFVRAFRGIRKFRGDSSFHTWLYRIALNVIRTHLDRRGRQAPVWSRRLEEASASGAVEGLADVESVEATLVRRELIDRALAALPPDLRIAVTLRDIHGLDYREIAEALGVPGGTVATRILRARQRLRPLLEPLIGSKGQSRARVGTGVVEGGEGGDVELR